MKGFIQWIAGGISAMWTKMFAGQDSVDRRQDAIDKRQDVAFNQSIEFNAIITAQFKEQAIQMTLLRNQNVEQAAQMNVLRQRIDECDEDRLHLAKRVDELEKVTGTK